MGDRSKLRRHTQHPAVRVRLKKVMEPGGSFKMRMNMRTLCAAVFTVVLLLSVSACKKKVAAAPPPPPVVDNLPPPPPAAAARINTFTVEPASIQRGQAATLAWSVANATDINIDNGVGEVQANGNRQVSPNNTSTYTLTARGAGGMDSRAVT